MATALREMHEYKTHKILCYISLYRNDDTSLNKLMLKYSKLHLIVKEKNIYERFAINNYKKNITDFILDNEEYYLYYFHTKGLKNKDDPTFNIFSSRRQLLNYYTLIQYNINIKLLEIYDAVGCSLNLYPKKHFSGNFWWSKSSYLQNLGNINDNYLSPEMYILSNDNCKYISLANDTNNVMIEDYILPSETTIYNNLTTDLIIIEGHNTEQFRSWC
jgi:hypothetical protein